MFGNNYYCLVASLREYSLDSETKGFDLSAIREEILSELSKRDAKQVQLLYGYYDCENLIARRAGRESYNPLGLLSREEIDEALQEPASYLPKELAQVVEAYAVAEDEEQDEEERTVDTSRRFEQSLLEAYYLLCAHSKSRFLKVWSEFDRTLRNIAAAATARTLQREVASAMVGKGFVVEQLSRSSAADFGLRGELPYIDTVLAAVNDEQNLVEKEHKIDLIRWNESQELSVYDYFNVDFILSYLVRMNIVARWTLLDKERGRRMFERLLSDLDAKEMINKQ